MSPKKRKFSGLVQQQCDTQKYQIKCFQCKIFCRFHFRLLKLCNFNICVCVRNDFLCTKHTVYETVCVRNDRKPIQGSNLTLAYSQNASYFNKMRVKLYATRKIMRVQLGLTHECRSTKSHLSCGEIRFFKLITVKKLLLIKDQAVKVVFGGPPPVG